MKLKTKLLLLGAGVLLMLLLGPQLRLLGSWASAVGSPVWSGFILHTSDDSGHAVLHRYHRLLSEKAGQK